jgi:TonB family protein
MRHASYAPRRIAALACSVSIPALCGAQVVSRPVGVIPLQGDTIRVSATNRSVVVLWSPRQLHAAPILASATRTRAWAHAVDSIERIAAPAAGDDGRSFHGPGLAALQHQTVSYDREVRRGAPDSNHVALADGQGRSVGQVSMSTAQLDLLLRLLDSAAVETEQLTQAAASAPPVVVSSGAPGRQLVVDNGTYFEFQVDKQAVAYPDNPAPRYPQMLRTAGVEGAVLAQFVVDTAGHPMLDTFKVLKSTHDLFTQAVRDALPTLRFSPAEIGGRKVRQLVQMPFPFTIKP